MTENNQFDSLKAHLKDLEENSRRWHKTLSSAFLSEEEQAAMHPFFPPSEYIHYDGGYPGAMRKKIIFFSDEEDGFSDIVCLHAKTDQRFRHITHRDVLGAVMHLQVDRSAIGDLWVTDDSIYLYTSSAMSEFFTANLTRINQLSVHFEEIPDHPSQHFQTKEFHGVIASGRIDAITSFLTKTSRTHAKEMIRNGMVQINHTLVEDGDKLCDNNDTISIRGYGRFVYLGESHTTKSGRIAADFLQYI